MKNSKLVKIVLIIIIGLALTIVSNYSFAAPTSLDPSTINNITGNGIISDNENNVAQNNIIQSGTTSNNTINNAVLTTNNTSNYNNTSLPKTGVGDSMPVVVLAVVLGISAIYAYKKIQDYKNI